MSPSTYKICSFILVSCTIVCITSCSNKGEIQVEGKQGYILPDSIARKLEIDSVLKMPVVKSINLTGKVTANEDHIAKIYPLVSGIASEVKVALGDYVHAGEELAIIRSSEMAGYSTDLITAETNVRLTKKSMEAAADMYKSGL